MQNIEQQQKLTQSKETKVYLDHMSFLLIKQFVSIWHPNHYSHRNPH